MSHRINQTVSSVVTKYLLDTQPGLAKVIAADNGTSVNRYVHDLTGIHSQKSGGSWSHTLQDGLGSLRAVYNSGMGEIFTAEYDPYGEILASSGTNPGPFAFTGEPLDQNGLQYHRARYYDPGMGVWISEDSLETANRYGYVSANPINRVDPSGLIYESPGAYGGCSETKQSQYDLSCTRSAFGVISSEQPIRVRRDEATEQSYYNSTMWGGPYPSSGTWAARLFLYDQLALPGAPSGTARFTRCSDKAQIHLCPKSVAEVTESGMFGIATKNTTTYTLLEGLSQYQMSLLFQRLAKSVSTGNSFSMIYPEFNSASTQEEDNAYPLIPTPSPTIDTSKLLNLNPNPRNIAPTDNQDVAYFLPRASIGSEIARYVLLPIGYLSIPDVVEYEYGVGETKRCHFSMQDKFGIALTLAGLLTGGGNWNPAAWASCAGNLANAVAHRGEDRNTLEENASDAFLACLGLIPPFGTPTAIASLVETVLDACEVTKPGISSNF